MRATRKLKVVEAFDYERAFSRNIGVIDETEQRLLSTKRVAIPGCGGVGGIYALVFARMGVTKFSIADFDTFEIENFNRQFGAKKSTLGAAKCEVIRNEILDINPHADVRVFPDGVTDKNIDDFLSGVDVIVDGLDFFAFGARDLLFPAARELGIPLVTAAPLGLSCALLVFTPTGMSYEDYFSFSKEDSTTTKSLKFALGLAPKATQRSYMDPKNINLEEQKGPSNVTAVTLCAAIAGTEALKLLIGRGKVKPAPHFRQYDAYFGKQKSGYLWLGNRNPWQKLKLWIVRRFYLGIK
jgi:molybdopterin/thiamine biosynthesis adenylyltransferase